MEKLLPAQPEGLTTLKFTEMKVGSRGWVNLTGDIRVRARPDQLLDAAKALR